MIDSAHRPEVDSGAAGVPESVGVPKSAGVPKSPGCLEVGGCLGFSHSFVREQRRVFSLPFVAACAVVLLNLDPNVTSKSPERHFCDYLAVFIAR